MKNKLHLMLIPALLCASTVSHAADTKSLDLTVKATIGNPTPPDVEIRCFVDQAEQAGNVTFDLGGDTIDDGTNTYWGAIDGLTAAPAKFSDFSTNARGAVEIYDKGASGLIHFDQIKLSATGGDLSGATVAAQKIKADVYGLAAQGLDMTKVAFDAPTLPANFYTNIGADAVKSLSTEQVYDLSKTKAGQSVFLPIVISGNAATASVTSWTADKFSGQVTVTVTPTFTNIF